MPCSASTRPSSPPVPQSAYATKTRSYRPASSRSFLSTAGAINSGLEWSLAGRQRTVTFRQPLSRITASTSRAIAPQPRMSTSGRSASRTRSSSGRSSCCTAGQDKGLGGFHGNGCVAAICVRADRLAEVFVQGGTADEDDGGGADPLLLQRLDHDLHVGHCCREERRHAQDVRLVLLERGEVDLDGVVDAEVVHLEPRALEHHRDEVLPDVVDVALDGADHDLADAL